MTRTYYIHRALDALRAQGYPVLDADIARLPPFVRAHIGIDGHHSIHLPGSAESGGAACATGEVGERVAQ
ncbi:hypothetical protein [Nocardia gipuzkoensis]|uniref:hypothetical protein n=1 Tax=Nocardia gipuzkoensis TaxID=2749991 RepID=UPI003EE40017